MRIGWNRSRTNGIRVDDTMPAEINSNDFLNFLGELINRIRIKFCRRVN